MDPPKRHDVGEVLLAHRDRLPEEWHPILDQVARESKRLFEERGLAFYGDEGAESTDSGELFDRTEAEEVISFLDRLLPLYDQLVRRQVE